MFLLHFIKKKKGVIIWYFRAGVCVSGRRSYVANTSQSLGRYIIFIAVEYVNTCLNAVFIAFYQEKNSVIIWKIRPEYVWVACTAMGPTPAIVMADILFYISGICQYMSHGLNAVFIAFYQEKNSVIIWNFKAGVCVSGLHCYGADAGHSHAW